MAAEEADDAGGVLQLGDIDVEVHPIDALHLQGDVRKGDQTQACEASARSRVLAGNGTGACARANISRGTGSTSFGVSREWGEETPGPGKRPFDAVLSA